MFLPLEKKDNLVCGFLIRQIPDFLKGQNLLSDDPAERLAEHCQLWPQLLHRLWFFKNTVFCLRYVNNPTQRKTFCFFLAKCTGNDSQSVSSRYLQSGIDLAIRSFGIVPNTKDPEFCIALLDSCSNRELPYSIQHELNLGALEINQNIELGVLIQKAAIDIWNAGDQELTARIERVFRKDNKEQTFQSWVPQLWSGAKGTFQTPFRALAETTAQCILNIYATPTTFSRHERGFIDNVRLTALKGRQQTQSPDLGAECLSSVADNAYLRLLSQPWKVCVECISTDGNKEDVRSVLSAVAAEIQHDMYDHDVGRMPASKIYFAKKDRCRMSEAIQSHNELFFPKWMLDNSRPKELRELELLSDARGVSSVFRLPANAKGGIPGLNIVQLAPDRISNSLNEVELSKNLRIGRFESGIEFTIATNELTQHALITGFTGSGKTTTILQLLHQLWHLPGDLGSGPNGGGIPFLVIEAAKKEYRGLAGVKTFFDDRVGFNDQLLVSTVGNENCAPFRLNPFAILPGLRIEAHINRLQACFEAALPPMPFLPSVLAESLEKVYKRKFWVMTDEYDPKSRFLREFPTMKDFYKEVEIVVKARGYQGDVEANVRAATLGRIKQLLMGSTGFIFAQSEKKIEDVATDLFKRPMILELNDLNVQDKALLMMLILTFLREYRELNPSDNLCHVTVVEEAHNVLGKIESEGTSENAGSDIRAKSIEYFCNMLAEMRSLGQGLIISDQSPNKLARDAIRNTNVQIAHQLRDANDRDTIANAMIMDAVQRDFLGKLKPGKAAIFKTGMEKAGFASIIEYPKNDGKEYSKVLRDSSNLGFSIKEMMAPYLEPSKLDHPFTGCQECGCSATCDYRQHSALTAQKDQGGDEFNIRAVFDALNNVIPSFAGRQNLVSMSPEQKQIRNRKIKEILDICVGLSQEKNSDSVWCMLLHLHSRFGPELDRRELLELSNKKGIVDKYLEMYFKKNNAHDQ